MFWIYLYNGHNFDYFEMLTNSLWVYYIFYKKINRFYIFKNFIVIRYIQESSKTIRSHSYAFLYFKLKCIYYRFLTFLIMKRVQVFLFAILFIVPPIKSTNNCTLSTHSKWIYYNKPFLKNKLNFSDCNIMLKNRRNITNFRRRNNYFVILECHIFNYKIIIYFTTEFVSTYL